jgi:hypothetical protein
MCFLKSDGERSRMITWSRPKLYLDRRRVDVFKMVPGLQTITLTATDQSGMQSSASVRVRVQGERKGDEFGATGVLAAILLQLLPPIPLLVVVGLNFVCLWRFRGKTAATATAKSTPAGP